MAAMKSSNLMAANTEHIASYMQVLLTWQCYPASILPLLLKSLHLKREIDSPTERQNMHDFVSLTRPSSRLYEIIPGSPTSLRMIILRIFSVADASNESPIPKYIELFIRSSISKKICRHFEKKKSLR